MDILQLKKVWKNQWTQWYNVQCVNHKENSMIRMMILLLLLMASTSCSEIALIGSGTSLAISQNTYAKAYGGIDFLTIMQTETDIKTHAYNKMKEVINGNE